MRWDDLFRDLEAQLEAAAAGDLAAEVADRARRESALLSLVDRARGAVGHQVSVRVTGVGPVEGVLQEVGSQWLLLAEPVGREALVPLAGVVSLTGLRAWTGSPGSAGRVFARLGLASALRGIARDRSTVTAWLIDGSTVSGTVDRVGADFIELTERIVGERHTGSRASGGAVGAAVRTVPMSALTLVRRLP